MTTTNAPLLRTKFVAPPPPRELVPRPRLLERLDHRRSPTLTVISAPAGFGKSTLASAWAYQSDNRGRVAWLSLDPDDRDPVRFFHCLTAALQQVEPGIGQDSSMLLGRLQMPAPKDLMALLLNELGDSGAPLTLVLNDYHLVTGSEIDAAIACLVDHAPPRLRLILTSRVNPALPLARWRSQLKASELGVEDLRLSVDESVVFLERAMGLALDRDAVRCLDQRTEGWVAGLQIAGLALQQREGVHDNDQTAQLVAEFGGQHRYVIDLLAAEVLRHQPGEVHDFLRRTAVLDRLCGPLCDAMAGRDDGASMLARLERDNLFLLPLDSERQWFRFHQLFADFLRSSLDGHEQRLLHLKASAWHEANGSSQEAMKHALAAQDEAAVVRLFRAQAEQLLSRGETLRLLTWLEALPDDVVRSHPDLCAYKAWLLYLRGRNTAAKRYAGLVSEVDSTELPTAQRAMLLTFKAYLAINWGVPCEAIPPARQALELLEETQSLFRVYALSFLGQALNLTGDRRAALDAFRQAVEVGRALGNHLVTLDAIVHLAPMLCAQGRLREAVVLCRNAADDHVDARGKPLPVAGLVHVALGVLYYELNELALCRQALDTGVALCQRLGMVDYTLLGQRALARLQHTCGEREAAWNTLAAARELAEGSENPGRWRSIAVLTAELQLREGNVAAAKRTLATLGEPRGTSAEYQSLTAARLALADGEPRRAQEMLRPLRATAIHDGGEGSLVAINVFDSLCRLALRDRAGAADHLAEAVSLAASGGYRRVLLAEGLTLASLLPEARHAAPEFVDDLLEVLPIRGNRPQAETSALVEPLSKSQLHILRLLDRGHTNREIADSLTITVGTTKWHLNQMFGKLQVHNRTAAIARARDLGLL